MTRLDVAVTQDLLQVKVSMNVMKIFRSEREELFYRIQKSTRTDQSYWDRLDLVTNLIFKFD